MVEPAAVATLLQPCCMAWSMSDSGRISSQFYRVPFSRSLTKPASEGKANNPWKRFLEGSWQTEVCCHKLHAPKQDVWRKQGFRVTGHAPAGAHAHPEVRWRSPGAPRADPTWTCARPGCLPGRSARTSRSSSPAPPGSSMPQAGPCARVRRPCEGGQYPARLSCISSGCLQQPRAAQLLRITIVAGKLSEPCTARCLGTTAVGCAHLPCAQVLYEMTLQGASTHVARHVAARSQAHVAASNCAK